MMDAREAIKSLTIFSNKLENLRQSYNFLVGTEKSDDAERIRASLSTTMKEVTRDALILQNLILEDMKIHHKQLLENSIEDVTELVEALNRSRRATTQARQLALDHQNELDQVSNPIESPIGRALREFLEKLDRERAAEEAKNHERIKRR